MRPPPHSFHEALLADPTGRTLLIEHPQVFKQLLQQLSEAAEPVYLDDPPATRVMGQVFVRARQDFNIIIDLLQHGYEIQASTLASGMMEAAYFINYIRIKPEKAQAWLDHDEWRWGDNFNNWLVATTADMVRTGEISPDLREQWEASERTSYSILCASKHNNGFALRKPNVVMVEPGKPEVVTEPAYTGFSLSSCAFTTGTVMQLAYLCAGFYGRALNLTVRLGPLQELMDRHTRKSTEVANEVQAVTGQPLLPDP